MQLYCGEKNTGHFDGPEDLRRDRRVFPAMLCQFNPKQDLHFVCASAWVRMRWTKTFLLNTRKTGCPGILRLAFVLRLLAVQND